MTQSIMITGGAGFIGSALIRYLINNTTFNVINVDKLTYSGNLISLSSVSTSARYQFFQLDICDRQAMAELLARYQPDFIMHLAAESHVDRSIDEPAAFIQTNIVGTFTLLEAARAYWQSLSSRKKAAFRFHHISTDEVYGELAATGLFNENSPYAPSSPYSASKASSDHLVSAWHRTYGLPIIISHCSNNYGPYHFPEKLIPLVILNALHGKPIPVYGNGQQIRDWLYVDDHVRALVKILTTSAVGERYNIGGFNEKTNLEVIDTICGLLEQLIPENAQITGGYRRLISFVKDRPGHDVRYAIDANKLKQQLGWQPLETFGSGMRKTVQWYLNNQDWCDHIQQHAHHKAHDELHSDLP